MIQLLARVGPTHRDGRTWVRCDRRAPAGSNHLFSLDIPEADLVEIELGSRCSVPAVNPRFACLIRGIFHEITAHCFLRRVFSTRIARFQRRMTQPPCDAGFQALMTRELAGRVSLE